MSIYFYLDGCDFWQLLTLWKIFFQIVIFLVYMKLTHVIVVQCTWFHRVSLLHGSKITLLFYSLDNILIADDIPTRKAMLLQIFVAMKAMPWYVGLPTVSEYMIENGWTKCFARISDIGWFAYLVYLVIYLVLVEFGIYWMHRELHDIKFLYKHLHATHHIYNKQNTLSPFAGMF